MGFFKKRDRVIDLTEKYRKEQEVLPENTSAFTPNTQENQESATDTGIAFLGDLANAATGSSTQSSDSYTDLSSTDERKRKLAKRLTDMTEKIEDLSNQIYHLQQRIELLEKKADVNNY